MKRNNSFYVVFILFVISCSSTRITSTWKAEIQSDKHFQKILVLGLIHDHDRYLQEKMEQHMVDDLRNKGFESVGSLQEFGPKYFDKLNEELSIAKIGDRGFDAVITIVLLDKKKEKHYVPGNIYYSPYSPYYRNFWRYRSTLYFRIYEPGYFVTNTEYFWESNLYELPSQKLLYSVQTKSFDPNNTEKLSHEYGELIIDDMIGKGLVK